MTVKPRTMEPDPRIIIWHDPDNAESNRAIELLQDMTAAGLHLIEYLKTPPDADAIRTVLAESGLSAQQLLDAGSPELSAAGIDPHSDEQQLIAAMAKEPRLIRCPVVRFNGKATVARPAVRALPLFRPEVPKEMPPGSVPAGIRLSDLID